MKFFVRLSFLFSIFVLPFSASAASLDALFEDKSVTFKSEAKVSELVSAVLPMTYERKDYTIEIVEPPVETVTTYGTDSVFGVEILVRAWRDGVQFGFGPDGTVDIERFRIYNPPVLVPDEFGAILRDWADFNGDIHISAYTEDPVEALFVVLESTFPLAGRVSESIVPGKIGRTTDVYYPAAGAAAPFDGVAGFDQASPSLSWASIHDAAASGFARSNEALDGPVLLRNSANDGWQRLWRGIIGFDSSAIADTDTVTSATLSLQVGIKSDDGYSSSLAIDSCTPGSASTISVNDYNVSNFDGLDQANRIAYASVSTGAYNDFTLNATGISNISKTGYTWLCPRLSFDLDNSEPSSPGADTGTGYYVRMADTTGTTQDPKLTVVHSEYVPPDPGPGSTASYGTSTVAASVVAAATSTLAYLSGQFSQYVLPFVVVILLVLFLVWSMWRFLHFLIGRRV